MKVIYVDDEKHAILRFEMLAKKIEEMGEVKTFTDAFEAIKFVEDNHVDIAFLDIQMPKISGIDLAKKLKLINQSIRIIFATAHNTYALDAFEVDAAGYLLKPYDVERLRKAFERAKLIKDIPTKKVYIKTFSGFDIFVDGEMIHFSRPKPKELLALLVDRQGSLVTSGIAISCLWEDRENDESTGALYRMTGKRLKELLAGYGIDFILGDGYKCVNPNMFECDYYHAVNGNNKYLEQYNEDYMPEYFWGEETNARLYNIKMNYLDKK